MPTRTTRIRGPASRAFAILGRVAVLLLLWPPSAALLAGGVETALPPDFSLYHQSGPFAWNGILGLSGGYTSNVFSSGTEVVSDFTGALTPQLAVLVRPGERSLITARQRFDRTMYADTRFLNTTGSATSLSTDLFLKNIGLHAAGSYNTARVRPIERLDVQPRQADLGVQAGMSFEHGNRFTTGLTGSIRDTAYRDDLREPFVSFRTLLNRREMRGNLDVAYRIARKTWLTAAAERMQANFDEAGNPRNSQWNRLLTGLRFDPTASVSGSLRAGALRISPERSGDPAFHGLIFDSSLNYRIGDRLALGVAASRDVQFTVYLDNSWIIRGSYSGQATWQMTRRMAVESGAELSTSGFPEPALETRRDRDRRAYAGIVRRLGQHSQAGVRYTLFRRNSTIDTFDLNISTITGSFVYIF